MKTSQRKFHWFRERVKETFDEHKHNSSKQIKISRKIIKNQETIMPKRQFYMLLIIFAVLVSANSHSVADNATETRSFVAESSVVNDNICNNREKNVAFDVILFDNNSPMQREESKTVNKRQAPRDDEKEYKDRPRPDQRSLLIVFDATGSMHDDLEQLQVGAQEIVNELSAREDNPIYNYVLVVYRDPSKFAALSVVKVFFIIVGQSLRGLSAAFINSN